MGWAVLAVCMAVCTSLHYCCMDACVAAVCIAALPCCMHGGRNDVCRQCNRCIASCMGALGAWMCAWQCASLHCGVHGCMVARMAALAAQMPGVQRVAADQRATFGGKGKTEDCLAVEGSTCITHSRMQRYHMGGASLGQTSALLVRKSRQGRSSSRSDSSNMWKLERAGATAGKGRGNCGKG